MPRTGNRTESLVSRERINLPLTADFVTALAKVGIVTAVDAINALAKAVKYDGECIPPFAGRPNSIDSIAALNRALRASKADKATIAKLISMLASADDDDDADDADA